MMSDRYQILSPPPDDALGHVFTSEVLANLGKVSDPSEQLAYRLEVLSACGPYPSDTRTVYRIRSCRARKAAWETYLSTGFSCGMFDGEHGKDLRSRLTGVGDDNFWSAMAECLVCWLLAGKLKLPVRPRPRGRDGKTLELLVDLADGGMRIEVKAPSRERLSKSWSGDDSDILARCLRDANKQFEHGVRNVLVLVPMLRTSVYACRGQLIRAFYGEEQISVPINHGTGEPAKPVEVGFAQTGKFLKHWKPTGNPRFTRVSAVLCVEERPGTSYPLRNPFGLYLEGASVDVWRKWYDDEKLFLDKTNTAWVSHALLVLHNPYAEYSIPREPWGDCPQFVDSNGMMSWTDGHELFP